MRNATLIALAMVAAAAMFGLVAIGAAQSADAWHSLFQSKKECVNYMKTVLGNTTSQAQLMCVIVAPH